MNDYTIVLYSRLSSDDGFMANDESNSIVNQKKLLDNFVKNHEELSKCKTIHISDDGYSGTNFNRPGAEKMLAMARERKIQCIIVKDLSRFGRNYIEVGGYVEEVFPFLGIRFISVNDFFDSKTKQAAGSLDIGFKNLIHSYYPQETSRKVSQGKIVLTKMGKFVSSFAFFGYVKSKKDKRKIVIDEPAAEIVRYIFNLRLQGLGIIEIARRLNAENVMTPIERKRQLGEKVFAKYDTSKWTQANVRYILYDERYTGKYIYRKTKTKSVVCFERVKAEKDEWIVIEDMYEAIISKEIFDKVIAMKPVRNPKRSSGEEKLFSRILKCGYCGKALVMRNNKSLYYYCQTKRFLPDAECKDVKITENDLANTVLKMIQLQADMLLSYKERKKANALSESEMTKRKILELQSVIDKTDAEIFEYYEQFKNGIIDKETFLSKKNNVRKASSEAQAQIGVYEEKLQRITEMEYIFENDEFSYFEKCKNIKVLDRELLRALISRIDVYSADRIEIIWKYKQYIEGDLQNV